MASEWSEWDTSVVLQLSAWQSSELKKKTHFLQEVIFYVASQTKMKIIAVCSNGQQINKKMQNCAKYWSLGMSSACSLSGRNCLS